MIAAVTLLVSITAFGLSYRYQAKQLGAKDSTDNEAETSTSPDLFDEEDATEINTEDSEEQKEE